MAADILVAGGGIAGSTAAILLGRRGFEVELFERETFPREKPCGEGVMPAGVAVLERMGLAAAVGGAPFRGIRYHFGEHALVGPFPRRDGVLLTGVGQRRRHLDRLLFDAASRTPGVTARAGAAVESPILEGGRVCGLRISGQERRARLVVAADGARSSMRRGLGLDVPARRRRIGMRRHFRLARGSGQSPWVDVFVRRGHELYVSPLPDGEVLVAGLSTAEAVRGGPERAFESWWRGEDSLARRLEEAEAVSDLAGAGPLEARARAGVAPGVVLLGDASGFLDPITGGGIAQALVTAELLAHLAPERLDDDGWLREFDRARRRLLRDHRMLTGAMVWLTGHPRLARATLDALSRAPALFSHLVGVSAGVRRLLSPVPIA
jgi:flavin-dependent dehydrogenase